MITGEYITITTVEPYQWPDVPHPPRVTGERVIWAPYVRGCLAAHPTTYQDSCPDETRGDTDDWTVTHLPTGGALALHVPREQAVRLVDAWQAVPLADIHTYDEMWQRRIAVGARLTQAANGAGIATPLRVASRQ